MGVEGSPKADRAVRSCELEIQPRARLLPVPSWFHLEDGEDLRPWLAGNDKDTPSGGPHQVDPRRESSWAPAMPDILLARRTGNAYPTDYDGTRMYTTQAYRDLAPVSHAVHRVLRERRRVTVAEIRPLVVAELEGRISAGDLKRKVPPCIRDTLRDLRLYGLATADRASGVGRATFVWVDSEEVSLLS